MTPYSSTEFQKSHLFIIVFIKAMPSLAFFSINCGDIICLSNTYVSIENTLQIYIKNSIILSQPVYNAKMFLLPDCRSTENNVILRQSCVVPVRRQSWCQRKPHRCAILLFRSLRSFVRYINMFLSVQTSTARFGYNESRKTTRSDKIYKSDTRSFCLQIYIVF